jgi:predicted GNAT family acetyltransferase
MDEPKVTDNREAGRFEVHLDGAVAGYAEYRRAGSTLSLTHTFVEPRYEGHGVGSVLARGALDAARGEGLSVLPFCPFIREYIARHEEYLDLVPASERARFSLQPADAGSNT